MLLSDTVIIRAENNHVITSEFSKLFKHISHNINLDEINYLSMIKNEVKTDANSFTINNTIVSTASRLGGKRDKI